MSNLSKAFFHRLPPSLSLSIAPSRPSAVLSTTVSSGQSRPRVHRYRSKVVRPHVSSKATSSSSSASYHQHPSSLEGQVDHTTANHTTTVQTQNKLTPMDLTLESQLATANALFNELRLKPDADPVALEEAKKRLGELKKTVAKAQAKEKAPKVKASAEAAAGAGVGAASSVTAAGAGGKDAEGKKKERMLLKTAKGTRDYGPSEMFCRLHIENIVKSCFTTYGGTCLDTPVFERKDILTDKYGEDAKLIFDLQDQGGEQLSLRYDHTVPLARYFAMNGATGVGQSKIWQVGKVYRRDNPVVSKGRMREFLQADFDITGVWDTMIPDAEILSLVCNILSKLDVGPFTVKINHRKILDGIFESCGVPLEKTRMISSAVDKLDKLPWADVKKEMVEEKGLDPAVADRIGEYVKHKGGPELLEKLLADPQLTANKSAKTGLDEMSILFRLLNVYGVIPHISFDMSLARGLDYYTGIIYEAIVEGSAPPSFNPNTEAAAGSTTAPTPTPKSKPSKKEKLSSPGGGEEDEIDENSVGVGSVAGGGRYDNLVASFISSSTGKEVKPSSPSHLPCVGVSIGLDRIFALVYPKWQLRRGTRAKTTMVYVMAAGDGLLDERVRLVKELREQGVSADFLAKAKPKLGVQFAAGEKDEVPFAVLIGEEEVREGYVMVKEQKWVMSEKEGEGKVKVVVGGEEKGVRVERGSLVGWLKGREGWRKAVEDGEVQA